MTTSVFYFDIECLVTRKMETFPIHAGNDDLTIGVRDLECSGRGPAFFAERRRLGSTELEAVERSKDLLEQRDQTIIREMEVLQKQRERISELLFRLRTR